jgi:hypothetical protein
VQVEEMSDFSPEWEENPSKRSESCGVIGAYECAYSDFQLKENRHTIKPELLAQIRNPELLMPPLTEKVRLLLGGKLAHSA